MHITLICVHWFRELFLNYLELLISRIMGN